LPRFSLNSEFGCISFLLFPMFLIMVWDGGFVKRKSYPQDSGG
jgi:hypothetical protein